MTRSSAITAETALRAYAVMLNRLEVGRFADCLAEDFVYESQMVIGPLKSRQEFLDYIVPKLQVIARSGEPVFAEMGSIAAYGHQQPCVILAQGSPDNLVGTALAQVRDGKLSRLDLCIIPPPAAATRSGEYPR